MAYPISASRWIVEVESRAPPMMHFETADNGLPAVNTYRAAAIRSNNDD